MSHLQDKKVLISGGTKGIGFATAQHFASQGDVAGSDQAA